MILIRDRHLLGLLWLAAACAAPVSSREYAQQSSASSGGVPPVCHTNDDHYPLPGVCTSVSMPAGVLARPAAFTVLSVDSSNPTTSPGLVKEVAQTFQPHRAGHPGSVGVSLRLVSDTNLTTTDWDLLVDLVDLGPVVSGERPVIPVSAGSCNGSRAIMGRGRYNTRLLAFGVDTAVRINFSTTADILMVPEHSYAAVFGMEAPGISLVGLAANDDRQDYYSEGYAATRQMRVLSVDSLSGANCLQNPPFVVDALQDLSMYVTLDDGCVIGATYSCGRGACARTIPECDAYGNFNQCHPGNCTTDADCLIDPAHPDLGTQGSGACNNPSGLDYQGLCARQAETCNGVDDDCNGDIDDGLDDCSISH